MSQAVLPLKDVLGSRIRQGLGAGRGVPLPATRGLDMGLHVGRRAAGISMV